VYDKTGTDHIWTTQIFVQPNFIKLCNLQAGKQQMTEHP